ncbi:MAG: sulfurtransferase complex subunit TusB [Acidiferrobacterales bacterium]
MLHTVNKSPYERNSLATCLRLAKAGSTILLIEDAVYAALRDTTVTDRIREATEKHRLFALEPDLKARGLESGRLIEGIAVVDYGGFVDLVVTHEKIQSWL